LQSNFCFETDLKSRHAVFTIFLLWTKFKNICRSTMYKEITPVSDTQQDKQELGSTFEINYDEFMQQIKLFMKDQEAEGKKREEEAYSVKDVKSWLIFQAKTINWVNLGIVIILLFSLRSVQQQNQVNQATLNSISARESTLNGLLQQSNTLLTTAKADANFVNVTKHAFDLSSQLAFHQLRTLNTTANERLLSTYNVTKHAFDLSSQLAFHQLRALNTTANERLLSTYNVTKHAFDLSSQLAFHQLRALNTTANERLLSTYRSAATHLVSLNGTASALYTKSITRLNHPMKQTVYNSGSSTFITSTNPVPLYIKVRLVGGGAGGQGAFSNADYNVARGNDRLGADGAVSVFGNNLIVANGGTGGSTSIGGSCTCGTQPDISSCWCKTGGSGGNSEYDTNSFFPGGAYGISAFHGFGDGGHGGGFNAICAGMGGYSGTAGGAGGYAEAVIIPQYSSYPVMVGSGGAGGLGGACANSGMDGVNGAIIIEEYF
jgi:hypothetical protein